MKYTFLHMCILFFTLLCHSLKAQQTYTALEIEEDIKYLEEKLIRYHPNLYLYSKQDDFNAQSEKLKDQIQTESTELEAYRLLSSYSQIIRDGHTAFTPSNDVLASFHVDTVLFPFQVFWDGNYMHTIMDLSEEESISSGIEIISINGVLVKTITDNILNSLQHDGDNITYPTWILNNFFNAYYYFYYGPSDSFEIIFIDQELQAQTEKVKALCKEDIYANRSKRYPEFVRQFTEEKKSGITLETSEHSTATLTIKSFDNGILRKTYRQRFRASVRKKMKEVRKNGTETLIIDVRGNQGGHLSNGHFLLKRLMHHRYIMVECFTKVRKKCSKVANARNKPTYGPILGIKKPNKNRFSGKVYFLVDGGSFSCSGIVTHVIKSYDRGTIVGEETGGSAYSLVGSPNKKITLPNTGLNVRIPRLQFILQDLTDTDKSGTHPDVVVSSSYYDVLNNRDVVMDYVMNKIANP